MGDHAGRVEMEDCLLETMTGAATFTVRPYTRLPVDGTLNVAMWSGVPIQLNC
jgi:hypothetical protein